MGRVHNIQANLSQQLDPTEVDASVLEMKWSYLGHRETSRGLGSYEALITWDRLGRP